MSVCVVVADDHGARCASHALRAAGWGGVAFETDPAAAIRTTASGRACVLNAVRLDAAAVANALDAGAVDWRASPPELSEDEWRVLYGTGDFTPRIAANRLKSAREKLGETFERWKLPTP